MEFTKVKDLIAELKKYVKHKDMIGVEATNGSVNIIGAAEEGGCYIIARIDV